MALIKVQLGDLFDQPSDLIVLPCSTAGTITRFVAKRLIEYQIPEPKLGMQLGDVDIQPFHGVENVAQFVAFAVSVKSNTSSEEAIQKIGVNLGIATCEDSAIRHISAPLLGAGAGGLQSEKVVEALSEGFKKTAVSDAILTVFVLHHNVFARVQRLSLLASEKQETHYKVEAPIEPIRVFISHSGIDPRYKEWIVELATFLRSNGLDARLDQWHLRYGMDLTQWMANELQLADRVVIISDKRYRERADGRLGGVGWETMLIQGDMFSRSTIDNRYLVIVREDDLSIGIPTYLKTKYCIHWGSQASDVKLRSVLLKELYHVEIAPAIGEPPVFL